MIINRNESEVQVLGDIQKYKVSIDENNLQHIITILSSNLYSYPMQSFLREIISNAVDSHIEAGVDEPIIVTITNQDLAIRDFGTGISPERFHETYINIGSSTKRDSNEFIGHFGIGKYAALAVSDLVNITSYYNGKAYYYVMNKDIDQLHIDLIMEKDTNEHNGVEVKIPFTSSLEKDDWRAISFIKNIYVEDERKHVYGEDSNIAGAFNKRKVYSYKTFKMIDMPYPFNTGNKYTSVLVGCIPYRVDYKSLWSDKTHLNWADTFECLCPCINIGDVDITPNREGLLYSERTKQALMKAYDSTIAELTELWNISCSKKFDDFLEFIDTIHYHYGNKLKMNDSTDLYLPSSLTYKVIYDGFEDCNFSDLKQIINNFYYYAIKDYAICCYYGKKMEIQKGKNYLNLRLEKLMKRCTDSIVIAVPNGQGFSSKYIKGFLHEQFGKENVYIVSKPKISGSSIKRFIRAEFGITTITDSQKMPLIMKFIKELLKWLDKHIKTWDIIHSQQYLQYKENNREERTYVRNNAKISCRIWPNSNNYQYQYQKSDIPYNIIKHITSNYKKCRIVYAGLDSPFIEGFKGIGYPNLVIIGLSQSNLQLADSGIFPDWVRPIEELYSEDNRTLQRIAALEYIRKKYYINTSLPQSFPQHIRDLSFELKSIDTACPHINHSTYHYCEPYAVLDIVPEEKYDRSIMALYHQLEKYYNINNKLDRADLGTTKYNKFMWYFMMKAKKIRLDYNYYRVIKDEINRIINLL